MQKAKQFFAHLFEDYVAVAPAAQSIHLQIEREFGPIRNDHVAFRTFASPALGIETLERPFLNFGYERSERYDFKEKHLRAYGYVPQDPELPLVFLSELLWQELPEQGRDWIARALEQVRPALDSVQLLRGARPWSPPTLAEYRALERVSPYAAWLSIWGLRANHFTVAVHDLEKQPSLAELVAFLQLQGWVMNEEGGLLKGGQEVLLQQASTRAELVDMTFRDGRVAAVPSCYYEFAQRHLDASGRLYQGFVPQSANDIFESTTARAG